MKIHNIRLTAACNSSSTHSFIIANKPLEDKDIEDREFGWGEFIAASKEAKLDWLSLILYYCCEQNKLPQYIWDYYVKDWLNGNNIVFDPAKDPDEINYLNLRGYIDHQSIIELPCDHNGLPVKLFFEQLKEYVLQPQFAIVGGNDNYYADEADKHTELLKSLTNKINDNKLDQIDRASTYEFIRWDKVYEYWVLLRKCDGYKIRFSFDDREITRASAPELVDIKITDACPFGCEFCYQNSKADGIRASRDSITSLRSDLKHIGIPEVALGGGEPTTHPQFNQILADFKRDGFVVNFTSRNYRWFMDEANLACAHDNCTKVALSVKDAHDLIEVKSIIDYYSHLANNKRYLYDFFTIQIVDEVFDEAYLSFIEHEFAWDTEITVLGFKDFGRGCNYDSRKKPISFSTLNKLMSEGRKVNVDTAYIQKHKHELDEVEVDPMLYTEHEGMFSCYIDLVTNKMGESSYCDPSKMYAYNPTDYESDKMLLDIYKKIGDAKENELNETN